MVSKVAVIALVAIIATPILLGYAMNLTEETYTEYNPGGSSVNVTELLNNGTAYTYVHGDTYKLNTTVGYGTTTKTYPLYVTSSTSPTSVLPGTIATGTTNGINGTYYFVDYDVYSWTFNYVATASHHMTAYVTYGDDNSTFTIARIKTLTFDYTDNTLYYTEFVGNDVNGGTVPDATAIRFAATTPFSASYMQLYHRPGIDNKYVNLSSGFKFFPSTTDWRILFPEETKSALLTINLDSITGTDYSVSFEPVAGDDSSTLATSKFTLEKTTTAGVVNWRLIPADDPTDYVDLYYDPNRSDNTYQIYMELGNVREEGGSRYYDSHIEFKYIGGWTKRMGQANSYITYSYDKTVTSTTLENYEFDYIRFFNDGGGELSGSPIFRVDDAYFRAFQYYVIENQSYTPASFKNNPSTTINNVGLFGQSLSFGGNTYTVDSDGNITLGTHKVSANGLVLDSVPVYGGYENRINGIVVSTTAQPSTITFNGKWGASVSTIEQVQNTYTKTAWHAGSFGWDGIDQNFLMVGLLTSLGVFIALGIYARKKGTGGLIPLMIVTGCAAALFFVML